VPLKRVVLIALLAFTTPAAAAHKHALLIGINDYTASRLSRIAPPAPERDWPNLEGAVNDASDMRELLMLLHGFRPGDIIELKDQTATRGAILAATRQLAAGAQKGDLVLFYFAGHGSHVRNSLSDEPDKLDESIIPADSRRGAADIRDKELRRIFNAILDRGAHLTVILDSCYSGSGARGLLTAEHVRGIAPDVRDVRDGGAYGPRPENRGALVITASQDDEQAHETHEEHGRRHGAFTWAWLRAMRDASPGEAAIDTFTRADARLRAEKPYQHPVIAGDTRTPFLGTRVTLPRTPFAVERVRSDGTIVISGGWAHGASVGGELRSLRTRTPLTITTLLGLGQCEAHAKNQAALRSGDLLALTAWAPAPSRALRVSVSSVDAPLPAITAFARRSASIAKSRGVKWISDPTAHDPGFVLRHGTSWELVGSDGVHALASDAAALQAIAQLPRGSSLFVQVPPARTLIDGIGDEPVLQRVAPEDADYILAGRFTGRAVEYAWVRPRSRRSDREPLPVRSVWITDTGSDTAFALRDRALRLHRILAWNTLESPPQSQWPYHLAIRGIDGAAHQTVTGGVTYSLELRAKPGLAHASRRYVYVFAIDSYGQSMLLHPLSGSVENHFPLDDKTPPPSPIDLGARIIIDPPYGIDTYILLATDDALTDASILQWDGVRGAPPATKTALEQLLALTSSARRSVRIATPVNWSIERLAVESRATKGRRSVSQ
jgi:hypothetical protein